MKTPIRLFFGVLALVALGEIVVRATASEPATGHGTVLVLDNDRTLEGDIERVGDQYRIRRAVGETWVPADKGRRLCKNAEEAYDYLQKRANLTDPDERLRLAEWCRLHDLPTQALAEVRAAVELRPEHEPTRQLLNQLERGVASTSSNNPPASQSSPQPPAEAPPAPLVDLNTESLSQFITRVQPILMNACANCHGPNHPGTFRLTRVYEIGTAQRRASQQNAAEVILHINRERPLVSPLLTKALSVHGSMSPTAQPPLHGRETPAYRSLEEWVLSTLAGNPQLQERAAVAAAEPRTPEGQGLEHVLAAVRHLVPGPEPRPLEIKDAKPLPTADEFASTQGPAAALPRTQSVAPGGVVQIGAQSPLPGTSPGGVPPPPARTLAPPPAPAAVPGDLYDPSPFNQQMHPERKN